MRKRCDWWGILACVSLCPLQIPSQSVSLTIHHRPALSAPPTGGALVLGGICVTNFTLSPCPLTASLSLSLMCGQKTWCQRVGEAMGLLPLATWIPTQWWPREYPVSNGINGGLRESETERERVYVWHIRGLCELKSTLLLYESGSEMTRWTALRPVCVCVWCVYGVALYLSTADPTSEYCAAIVKTIFNPWTIQDEHCTQCGVV